MSIRLLLGVLLASIFFAMTGCVHPGQHMVVKTPTVLDQSYSISEPIVNNRIHRYEEVVLHDGDRVKVEAGGCVNTGGSGKTWKNYVSPEGANSARLYHGLIWLPGAAQGGFRVPVGTSPMRLEGVVGQTFTISASGLNPDDLRLYLGYEDDHYTDNGYYRDSAGANGDQCKAPGSIESDNESPKRRKDSIPRAYVRLKLMSTEDQSPPLKPLDLVGHETDANFLLKDPIWAKQIGTTLIAPTPPVTDLPNVTALCGSFPSLPLKRTWGFAACPNGCESGKKCQCEQACTSQAPSFDYPIDFSINKWLSCKWSNSLNGHANWVPVEYSGSLTWGGEQPFDEDADIFLRRPVGDSFDWSGFSAAAAQDEEMEIEMAGYETWDSFGTQWFKQDWDHHTRRDTLGSDAQVIGLMSVDCVHECKVELHPVFAMAVHVSGPTRAADGAWDDVWAIFARNWGTEGWCSHDEHYLDRDRITFILPGPEGTSRVEVVKSDDSFENTGNISGATEFKGNKPNLGIFGPMLVPGQGARLTLFLGSPDAHSRINGYLHLRWNAPPQTKPAPTAVAFAIHNQDSETAFDGSPRAMAKAVYDSAPVKRLTVEPVAPYIPSDGSVTLTAETKEKRERGSLLEWCKEHTTQGQTPEECLKNKEPNSR